MRCRVCAPALCRWSNSRICPQGPHVHRSGVLALDMITSGARAHRVATTPVSISRSAAPPLFTNETDELRLCEPGSPLSRRPGLVVVVATRRARDRPPSTTLRSFERDCSHLPRRPARAKSQTFTTRPPEPVRRQMFADLMSVPHPDVVGYFTALASWSIDRTSSGHVPSQAVRVPPVAYSKAMYMSADTGTGQRSRDQDPRARRGGVRKMLKILMMFGWSRRFGTTTSRRTRRAASTVWVGTRFSATTRRCVDRARTTAPKDPQPRRASRYRDPTFHVSTCPVSSFCASRGTGVVRQVRGTRDARGDGRFRPGVRGIPHGNSESVGARAGAAWTGVFAHLDVVDAILAAGAGDPRILGPAVAAIAHLSVTMPRASAPEECD